MKVRKIYQKLNRVTAFEEMKKINKQVLDEFVGISRTTTQISRFRFNTNSKVPYTNIVGHIDGIRKDLEELKKKGKRIVKRLEELDYVATSSDGDKPTAIETGLILIRTKGLIEDSKEMCEVANSLFFDIRRRDGWSGMS